MQYIEKGPEPLSLKKYKETPGVCFVDLKKEVKLEVKESLLREQGYICCYCGKRIELDESTIVEHLLCREQYPDRDLEYGNLLASCDGGQGERCGQREQQRKKIPIHCDQKKGNASIEISPLCPNCEDRFMYDEEGSIYGGSNTAQQVIDKLGLNCATVKNFRKHAIKAYAIYLDYPELTKAYPDFWQKRLEYNSTRDSEGKFPDYCFAARYYIKKYCLDQ